MLLIYTDFAKAFDTVQHHRLEEFCGDVCLCCD